MFVEMRSLRFDDDGAQEVCVYVLVMLHDLGKLRRTFPQRHIGNSYLQLRFHTYGIDNFLLF